ncbi:MAG: hypothetical protein Q4A92_03985 [Corynebacterium sp.]|nr:hypothetical protein [Corynebacterium sp.]
MVIVELLDDLGAISVGAKIPSIANFDPIPKTPGRPELAMLGQQNKPDNDFASAKPQVAKTQKSVSGDVRSAKQASSGRPGVLQQQNQRPKAALQA